MRFILIIILIFTGLLFGQNEPVEMETDRPDFTESSSTVPLKHLQVETGLLYDMDKVKTGNTDIENSSLNLATTLLRYGLTDQIELRLGSQYTSAKSKVGNGETTESGISGLYVGTKIYLADENGFMPQTSVILAAELPVGNENLVADNAAPGFIIAASHTVSEKTGLGYNFGGSWDNGKDFVFIYSAAYGIDLCEKTGLFLEVFGDKTADVPANFIFDTGVTYSIQPNMQFDASFGLGLNEEATDWFANAGFSIRLPQ